MTYGRDRVSSADSIRVASSDVEEATEQVGRVFHPHRLTRVGAVDHFHADLDAVAVGPMVSGRLRYNSSSDLYCPVIDGYHVNVPLTGRLLSISDGRPTTVLPSCAALYGAGADARILSPEHSKLNIFAVKIERHALHATLQSMLGRQVGEPIRFVGGLDLSGPDGRAWWTLLANTHRSQFLGSMMRDPRMAGPLASSLMTGLLALADHQFSDELRAPVTAAAPAVVARANEYIEAHLAEPLTIADIAAAVGLSTRALQRTFQRHTDTSPMQVLRTMRLRRAHEDLCAGDPGTTSVTTIATRWGFTNHGRFAQDYRKTYGTSPSETLRTCR
ncbi:AraC family transcriptional regulator [Pseudonocardia sp. WMMC193]|uniref:helix-turn-helix transcriptional regulator n=1 Tax=Pseudonocardia sp. WMMC193 TaxID=2911965 RepID=UPI001F2CCEA8|nr:AraC family transcriptional regulator [Pseudonocardia sp. WMMC193]MCF7551557.1 AraC family transcriptional regulator [Pseudonocardia sp. WMMC193]